MTKPNSEELKKEFKDAILFMDSCIPLGTIENYVHFISVSGQLYGFDTKKQVFFEPNSNKKFSLIDEYINVYFTDNMKQSLEERIGVKFDELVELKLRGNYKEKHIGKKILLL